MPNLWTHVIYGNEIMNALGRSSMLAPYNNLFHLGCQGPDPLFYHRFLPWQRRSATMAPLGSAMHQRDCGEFLLRLTDSARRSSDLQLRIFTLGFLLHHTLDRNMHPYIFVKSGFQKWHHQRFEIMLDTIFARRFLARDTWQEPAWKQIDAGPTLPDLTAETLELIAKELYPKEASDFAATDWNTAYRDMVRAQKLFHDPFKVKTVLTLWQIEPFTFKKRLPAVDLLNEQRISWMDPCDEGVLHTDSVWDLWERAMEDGIAAVRAAIAYLEADHKNAEQARGRFRELLGDMSYETGKPCSSEAEIRFVDPVI